LTILFISSLSKVNNWVPENYESIDEVPEEIKDVWQPNVITVKCFGSVSYILSPLSILVVHES